MRKIILSLLLASTAAAPAFAEAPTRDEREAAREERKAERAERAKARTERPDTRQAPRAERVEPREGRAAIREQRLDARQERVEQRATNLDQRSRPTFDERQATRDARADDRSLARDQRQDARDQRQETRSQRQAELARQRVRPPADARPDRPAPPPPQAEASHRAPTWSTAHWRHDHRYDWRRYRDRNRSLFRLGFYFDPFGWHYNRWGIGWRLWPSYYDRHYWLRDPWMYRLPYAPWPYQWIRYWDDALLVNTITGQVVDAEYNFFW